MRESCDTAGLAIHERRQIPNIINSLGGVVASFLGSQTIVGLPSALPSGIPSVIASIVPPVASAISQSTSTTSAQSSAPMPTTLLPTASQASAQSTPTSTSPPSSKSSSPPIGIIVGAVVGGLALLLLLAILIMLCLRHKRKKRETQTALPTYQSATRTHSLDETLVDRTPMVEHRTPIGAGVGAGAMMVPGREKEVYRSRQPDAGQNEMYTSANVWELDSREVAGRREMESPAVSRVSSPIVLTAGSHASRTVSPIVPSADERVVSPVVEDRRDRGPGFDFGFEERRTGRPGDELHF
jgi:hypothetical protein